MSILIDDRTGSRDLISLPPLNQPPYSATLSHLPYGDISFIGNGPNESPVAVGIELKSIPDLISSISTGRLQATQMAGMLQDYSIRWLLIYGRYRCNPADGESLQVWRDADYRYTDHANRPNRAGWYKLTAGKRGVVKYGYLKSFLLSPSFTSLGQFSFDHVESKSDAAYWIATLYRSWSRPYSSHKSMRVVDRSGEGKRSKHSLDDSGEYSIQTTPPLRDDKLEFKIEIASRLPSIGYERATALANHFPTVQCMINAGIEQLSNIEVVFASGRRSKLGYSIAKSIFNKVRGT